MGELTCEFATDLHRIVSGISEGSGRRHLLQVRAGALDANEDVGAGGIAARLWAQTLKSFRRCLVYFVWRITNEIHRVVSE